MLLALLKLLQSFVRTLHSEGTPHQIAAGFALGAALGLTPLMNPHNLLVIVALSIFNVSFGAGILAMALLAPLGFLLDPVFDAIGAWLLLGVEPLRPLWETIDSTALLALANLNNTVVLGSIVGWLILVVPLYLFAKKAVVSYRSSLGERIRRSRLYRAVRASRVYNVYSWFRE
jgi:uncharacterized protein (TIGR03546 family)